MGTSTLRCQVRKLRQGDSPSSEEKRTLRLDLPAAHPSSHFTQSFPSGEGEGEKHAGRRGRLQTRILRRASLRPDFPTSQLLPGQFPAPGEPFPASERPKPQHLLPRQPALQPAAPHRSPCRARGERGPAARPPGTIPRPQTARRYSPKVAARDGRGRPRTPASSPHCPLPPRYPARAGLFRGLSGGARLP